MYGQNQYYGQPAQKSPRVGGFFGKVVGGFTKYKQWKNGFGAAGNLLTGDVGGAVVDGTQAFLWGKTHNYLRSPRAASSRKDAHGGPNIPHNGGAYGYGTQNGGYRR